MWICLMKEKNNEVFFMTDITKYKNKEELKHKFQEIYGNNSKL